MAIIRLSKIGDQFAGEVWQSNGVLVMATEWLGECSDHSAGEEWPPFA